MVTIRPVVLTGRPVTVKRLYECKCAKLFDLGRGRIFKNSPILYITVLL